MDEKPTSSGAALSSRRRRPVTAWSKRRRLRVALASDLSLMSEAVEAALTSRDFEVFRIRWPRVPRDDPAGRQLTRVAPDVAVLIYELDLSIRMAEATELLRATHVPWLVMSGAGPDPTWGGVISAGARAVATNVTGLDEVTRLLHGLADRTIESPSAESSALVEQWRTIQRDNSELQERVDQLTPREREVLTMLRNGTSVREIADALELSEATVRSQVKAVLRKLGVNSQLAAVAAVGEVGEEERSRRRSGTVVEAKWHGFPGGRRRR